jgi:hypothetical protein
MHLDSDGHAIALRTRAAGNVVLTFDAIPAWEVVDRWTLTALADAPNVAVAANANPVAAKIHTTVKMRPFLVLTALPPLVTSLTANADTNRRPMPPRPSALAHALPVRVAASPLPPWSRFPHDARRLWAAWAVSPSPRARSQVPNCTVREDAQCPRWRSVTPHSCELSAVTARPFAGESTTRRSGEVSGVAISMRSRPFRLAVLSMICAALKVLGVPRHDRVLWRCRHWH